MTTFAHPRRVRVLFDETHSESWSISRDKAAQISPEYPEYSSYHRAAGALQALEFDVTRSLTGSLDEAALSTTDILALIHPCDPRWERTVGVGPSTRRIAASSCR